MGSWGLHSRNQKLKLEALPFRVQTRRIRHCLAIMEQLAWYAFPASVPWSCERPHARSRAQRRGGRPWFTLLSARYRGGTALPDGSPAWRLARSRQDDGVGAPRVRLRPRRRRRALRDLCDRSCRRAAARGNELGPKGGMFCLRKVGRANLGCQPHGPGTARF